MTACSFKVSHMSGGFARPKACHVSVSLPQPFLGGIVLRGQSDVIQTCGLFITNWTQIVNGHMQFVATMNLNIVEGEFSDGWAVKRRRTVTHGCLPDHLENAYMVMGREFQGKLQRYARRFVDLPGT